MSDLIRAVGTVVFTVTPPQLVDALAALALALPLGLWVTLVGLCGGGGQIKCSSKGNFYS